LQPDLFIFLGDNIYGDTRNMNVLRAKYRRLARQPGFRRLCERTPVLATWDDHDYGEDDAGADYPMKLQSRKIFCDFWSEPPDSPRRRRDGIYDAVLLGDGNHTLQIILPDLRFNRTPLVLSGNYRHTEVGPYAKQTSPGATMLGEHQWQWLEATLRTAADLRVFASSLQVVADATGWESWIYFPGDHQRLLDTIRRERTNGLFCISGDMHYGELSCMTDHVPYPLWDLTSSGLTEVWNKRPPNKWRVADVLHETNFGWIEIDWMSADIGVLLQLRSGLGAVRLEQRVNARQLSVVEA
jgi:alkaline phosphatase D